MPEEGVDLTPENKIITRQHVSTNYLIKIILNIDP